MNIKIGHWVRYKVEREYDSIVEIKQVKDLWTYDESEELMIILDNYNSVDETDIISSSSNIVNVIEIGDAYYYLNSDNEIVVPKMFINYESDLRIFKEYHDNYINKGAQLYIMPHKNMNWELVLGHKL